MKYYEMHEEVYKNLKENNFLTWDKEKDIDKILDHSINTALKNNLSSFFSGYKNFSALDLGTGTGVCALFLANEGFSVDAYDISVNAIEMAKRNATSLGLSASANFYVGDIVSLSVEKSYDLIVDSSCLHCIVHGTDREHFFRFVKSSLRKDGVFFMHTMIQSADMSDLLSRSYLTLKDSILWSTGPESWPIDKVTIDGQKVFPHRKLSTLEELEEEIRSSGLHIIQSEIKSIEKNPNTYIAWVKNKN
jgi:2-polyprenyl-3-methyl-5-hydroxy-6-metoxy-1,4-benzoquinol methylase